MLKEVPLNLADMTFSTSVLLAHGYDDAALNLFKQYKQTNQINAIIFLGTMIDCERVSIFR